MTYLNDVSDGGETEFFHQKLKVKPVKGKTVLWPTDFTHLHRGITSPTEDKYIATGWFNFLDAIDVSKMNDLGWTAKINIESGIKLTIESFKNEFSENTIRL